VTVIIFVIGRMIPGSAVDQMLAHMSGHQMGIEWTREDLLRVLGLDLPVHTQYINWIGGVFQGDLGNSLWSGTPLTSELAVRLPVSLELGVMAVIFGLLIATPIGVYSAIRQDTIGDYMGRTVAVLAISVPSFWLGTLVFIYPSIWWGWSPPLEYVPFWQDFGANLWQFTIPAIILGMLLSGFTMRTTRTMMLEVLRQDYVRTAWAKGLRERTVVWRHALKNALIPVVTIVGLMLPLVVGGAVVIEQIFCLPGIGRYLMTAISTRDYPVIQGINLVIASFILVVNLVVDLTYAWLDPRVTYR